MLPNPSIHEIGPHKQGLVWQTQVYADSAFNGQNPPSKQKLELAHLTLGLKRSHGQPPICLYW